MSFGFNLGLIGNIMSSTAAEARFNHELAQDSFAMMQRQLMDNFYKSLSVPSIFSTLADKKPAKDKYYFSLRRELQDETDEWLADAKEVLGKTDGIKGEVFVGVDVGREAETAVYVSGGLNREETEALMNVTPGAIIKVRKPEKIQAFGTKIVKPEWPERLEKKRQIGLDELLGDWDA